MNISLTEMVVWGDDRKHLKRKKPYNLISSILLLEASLLWRIQTLTLNKVYISVIYTTDGRLGGPKSLLKHTHTKTSKAI